MRTEEGPLHICKLHIGTWHNAQCRVDEEGPCRDGSLRWSVAPVALYISAFIWSSSLSSSSSLWSSPSALSSWSVSPVVLYVSPRFHLKTTAAMMVRRGFLPWEKIFQGQVKRGPVDYLICIVWGLPWRWWWTSKKGPVDCLGIDTESRQFPMLSCPVYHCTFILDTLMMTLVWTMSHDEEMHILVCWGG